MSLRGGLRSLIAGFVGNPVLANLLTLSLAVGGLYAGQALVREVFPEVSVDHVTVEVAYPGAGPQDVERAICTPIEKAVEGIAGVRQISSSANENFGTVWIGLLSNVRDSRPILEEVKDRVGQITTFPPEAKKPVVREATLRAEVIDVAIYGEAPEPTLKHFAQEVKDQLLARTEISQVTLVGVREEEITIEVSREALQAYNLSLSQVIAAVSKSSLDLPAGVIRTEGEEVTLRVTGQRYAAADYEDLVVLEHGDAVVRLRDIARVREGFEDVVSRGRFNGHPAVMVGVYKTPQEDSKRIAGIVREYVEARKPQLPERLQMDVWGDSSKDIDARLGYLVSNGLQGLLVLFAMLAVFLGGRFAFWVCSDIPLCFAGAVMLMWYFGATINMISLFALIMVGGIIVDDSIVIAESVHAMRKRGLSPRNAAIEGTASVAIPVLGSTLTTIASFLPLLFVAGVMGKFVMPVPIIIIAALLASTIDAFCVLLSHLSHLEEKGVMAQALSPNRVMRWIERRIEGLRVRWYRPLYELALDNRMITLAVATAALLLSVGLPGGRIPFVLLPKEDGSILRARIRFPEGTPLSVTEAAMRRLEQSAYALNDDPSVRPAVEGPLVRQVYSITGEFADFLPARGSNLCEVRLELMPAEQREVHDDRIIDRWRALAGTIHDATQFTIERQLLGPTDRPIEVRLLGDRFEDMAAASRRIQERLEEFAGIFDVHDDLVPGKRELQVKLKPAARALGLTLDDVARQLRQGFFGGEAVRLQREREQVKVRVRYPDAERQSVADLENLRIVTPGENEVPFLEAAQVEWERGYANIMHQDGKRRVRVLADIDERYANAEQIVQTLDAGFLSEVVGSYDGLRYVFGGDRQRTQESFSSLWEGFTLAIIAMYVILAAMLGSFVQPFVIMLTIPFGLIGALIGHVLMGYDVTMMSLFGLVAVSGIVVNHSLIVVEAVHDALREGKGLREALIQAGELRFQAILLTSITDLAGLLPLLISSPGGQAQSVMPMAISMTFGLMFAVVVTLFLVPAAYVAVNDVRRFARWVLGGGAYPTAEEVEDTMPEREAALAEG